MRLVKLLKMVMVMLYVSDMLVLCVVIGKMLVSRVGMEVKYMVMSMLMMVCSNSSCRKFGELVRNMNIG